MRTWMAAGAAFVVGVAGLGMTWAAAWAFGVPWGAASAGYVWGVAFGVALMVVAALIIAEEEDRRVEELEAELRRRDVRGEAALADVVLRPYTGADDPPAFEPEEGA